MSLERRDASAGQPKPEVARGFQGEEDIEGASTPQKDLVAAALIAAISAGAMVLAYQMPDTGRSVFTHPGLLPFVTGLTLLAMAIGLAVRALREGGAGNLASVFSIPADPADRRYLQRAWLLIALVVALVVAVDVVTFRIRIPVAGFEFRVSSFECVAIPFVTLIMKIYWGRSWLRCFIVAAVVTLLLASAFRYGFRIPMPGVY